MFQVSNNKMAPKKMYRQNSFYRLSTLLNLYGDSKCINNKNFTSFKNIVHCAVNKSPDICYELFYDFAPFEMTEFNKLNEICLDIASKHGLTIFVKSLLRDGVNPNRVNKFFQSAPIHFATQGGHINTLKALLAEPTINPNLQAGRKTALHIAVTRNDRICASMLLQKGANANIISEEQSALYLAAVKGEFNMVELILRKHKQNLDLDNYKKDEQRTRDMIQNLCPFFSDKFYHALQLTATYINDLHYYLTINDEKSFLENMHNDKMIFLETVETLLVTATENDLRTAVIKILDSFRIIDWFHIDNPIEKYVFRDTIDISAEQERKNDRKRLEQNQLIIKRAADVAVDKNRYVLLRELLNAMIAPKIVNNDFIIKVCKQLKQLKRCHISDWVECMKFMLDKEEVKLHELMDDECNTPLHYAAKSGYKEAIDLFLNQDCYIGHMNKNNTPPIAYIPMNTLSSSFDRCILELDEQTKESKIEFIYCCLKPYNDSQIQDSDIRKFPELVVFMYIADDNNLKHLLKHPLLSSFLYLKWHSIQNFLIFNFFINTSFYVLLNFYIYRMAINDSSPRQTGTHFVNDIGNYSVVSFRKFFFNLKPHENTVKLDNESRNVIEDSDYIWLWISIFIFLVIYILREFLKLVCCFDLYVKDWKVSRILLIVLTIALLLGAGFEIGIIVTLLSTWEFMILISRNCPWLSCITQYHNISMISFQITSFNFVRLLLPFVFLIGAFAFIFHKLFKDNKDNNFSNSVFSIVKTIIMLTGEFNVPFTKHDSVWSRVVFVIFVFLMHIVLMSMLNSLAISDTTKSKAELHSFIYRLYQVAYFENIACTIGKLPRKYFGNLVSNIFLFPQLEDGRVSYKIYDSKLKYFLNNFTLKMDYNILKQAKQIILNKNQLLDNDVLKNNECVK